MRIAVDRADLLEKHMALQERKLWVDSLGACHLRLRGTTFEALPDFAQAKGGLPPTATPRWHGHLQVVAVHFTPPSAAIGAALHGQACKPGGT